MVRFSKCFSILGGVGYRSPSAPQPWRSLTGNLTPKKFVKIIKISYTDHSSERVSMVSLWVDILLYFLLKYLLRKVECKVFYVRKPFENQIVNSENSCISEKSPKLNCKILKILNKNSLL